MVTFPANPSRRCCGFWSAVLVVFVCLLLPALAETWTTTATVSFDIPLTITKQSDIDFGVVVANTASTYTISTDGVVTATNKGAVLGGTQSAASLLISGSATQAINISVGSLTANNGVTIKTPTCSYAGGASGSCTISGAEPPGSGKVLLIGMAAVVKATNSAAGTSAAPTFVVTVIYN